MADSSKQVTGQGRYQGENSKASIASTQAVHNECVQQFSEDEEVPGDVEERTARMLSQKTTCRKDHTASRKTSQRSTPFSTLSPGKTTGPRNIFTLCSWTSQPQLIKDLRSAKCSEALVELTKSYLDSRQAETKIGNEVLSTTLTKGCPQGSEYGPDLWKLAVNPLLAEELPGGTELITYADDLAILVSGKNRAELTAKTNAVFEKATQWANQRKLTFSATKSQTFWFKGLLSKPLHIRLGGARIKPTPTAKYLSATFDQSGKFSTHLAEKAEDTKALFSQLHGVVKTNWGLKSGTPLRLYKAAFTTQARANSAQRIPLLTITDAYKTTSTHVLQELAGVPPLDLQLKELARIERDMVALRRNHYTSQLMSNHGDINYSFHRFNLRDDAACRGGSPTGTAEHLLFDCPLADQERTTSYRSAGGGRCGLAVRS
ncbi:hypothetical protein QTP88_029566 [Uroleucon formosanum]